MNRKIVFTNGEIYHVFNRGVDKREIFLSAWDYRRALKTIEYYKHSETPLRLSEFLTLSDKRQKESLTRNSAVQVEIVSYCLMPNHFHFSIKQLLDYGISNFMSNFANSYSKYFNTKNQRSGHLFQGRFKARHVEDDIQLKHLSRYIHLNPVASSVVSIGKLKDYRWSSYSEYLGITDQVISKPEEVLQLFHSVWDYEAFVLNQADYLESIKEMENLDFK